MYYTNTLKSIEQGILKKYPNARPNQNERNLPGYILWMVQQIKSMEQSESGSLKAARWIGWILRVVEKDLDLWDNSFSRDLVRGDVAKKLDRPS